MQIVKNFHYRFSIFRVQIATRLIGKYNIGMICQRPRYTKALLFASRKIFRFYLLLFGKPCFFKLPYYFVSYFFTIRKQQWQLCILIYRILRF